VTPVYCLRSAGQLTTITDRKRRDPPG